MGRNTNYHTTRHLQAARSSPTPSHGSAMTGLYKLKGCRRCHGDLGLTAYSTWTCLMCGRDAGPTLTPLPIAHPRR